MRVAIVGGTGDFGLALALRLVETGDEVVIGSRDRARAQEKALEAGAAAGATNEEAVRDVELVVLATNAGAALATAESLRSSLVSPLLSVASQIPARQAGSLAEETAEIVGVPVVAGLHSLAAASLSHGKADGDALVCGDDPDAKTLALELAGSVVSGRALDAGPLASARALEGLTAVIVNLNKRYRGHAGFRVTGLP
jgi:8-hydroxy-5-deazaflavin:NADPH oxidoreductase